ncbi:unnamed protein product [Microthlaspi erraticum]|nr:unnamed protein product [Microthlaspi erraticum]
MKLPDASKSIVDMGIGLKECGEKCLGNCKCRAYANANMQKGGSGCVIWVGELLDLRKNNFAGQDLFVRNKIPPTPSATTEAAAPIGAFQCAPMELVKIASATGNFSDSNKIGRGGFGIVYKGTLLDGQVIAAKRLSKRSDQGIEGFTNEVKMIASVQHRNLVQL